MKTSIYKNSYSLRSIVSVLGLLLCASTSFSAEKIDVEERSLPVGTAISLKANVTDADINVQSHDEANVRLVIHRKVKNLSEDDTAKVMEALKTEFKADGDAILLEDDHPNNSKKWKKATGLKKVNFSIRYEVWVPESFNLDIKAVDGDLLVGNIEGDCKLNTVDGDVTIEKASGSVRAKSIDGDIFINSVAGPVKAVTVDGDIMLKNCFAEVQARTVDGDIMASIVGKPEGDCHLEAVDGDVLLKLDPDLAFNIQAQTMDGKLEISLPLDSQTSTGRQVVGMRNGGGLQIMMNSIDGDIILKSN